MHQNLAPHLHTEQCNILIEKLKQCHKEHKYKRLVGYCNDYDREVLKCLRNEREMRRRENYEKALARRERARLRQTVDDA